MSFFAPSRTDAGGRQRQPAWTVLCACLCGKMFYIKRQAVWMLLCACLLLAACTTPEPLRLRGEAMGTTWQVTAYAPAAQEPALRHRIETRLDELTAQMSAWQPDSDLSRFNRAAPGTWHVLPADLFIVLEHALALSAQTGGAYEPGIAPLVEAWGFGPHGSAAQRPPSRADIDAALAQIGTDRLQLDAESRRALQPGGLRLDVNSLAPGYAVDAIAGLLHEAGVEAFLVELGGEMRAAGRKPDGAPWRAAVERPDMAVDEGFDTVVELVDAALGTSGDYRSGFVHDGRRYSHTLDPRTGEPVNHALAAVTVIMDIEDGGSAMAADARAAALMVLGPDAGMDFAREHGLAAVFTLRQSDGYRRLATPAFERYRAQ